jgi:hypothetical protein
MLSSDYVKSKQNFDYYKGREYYTQNMIQFEQQRRVRKELTTFLKNIYRIIQDVIGTDDFARYYKNEIIRYILRNGYDNNFFYVSYIAKSVDSEYYGTEVELKLSSLLYKQPIVAITGIQGVIGYELCYWDNYDIPIAEGDADNVLNFLSSKFSEHIYLTDDRENMREFQKFLTQHPQTYFLIGGRGHWSYGINERLLPNTRLTVGLEARGASSAPIPVSSNSGRNQTGILHGLGSLLGVLFGGGGSKGDNKINNKVTRKNIKNKTHKKQSHIKVKNKKTKKILKSNKNSKNSKKTRKNTY